MQPIPKSFEMDRFRNYSKLDLNWAGDLQCTKFDNSHLFFKFSPTKQQLKNIASIISNMRPKIIELQVYASYYSRCLGTYDVPFPALFLIINCSHDYLIVP